MLGIGTGAWDVAMNLQGAVVERRLDRPIMSRLHAGFSVGTVVGALVGAAVVALQVPVAAHLTAIAVLVAVAVPAFARGFLPDIQRGGNEAPRRVPVSPPGANPAPSSSDCSCSRSRWPRAPAATGS